MRWESWNVGEFVTTEENGMETATGYVDTVAGEPLARQCRLTLKSVLLVADKEPTITYGCEASQV